MRLDARGRLRDAHYDYVGHVGDTFWLLTDLGGQLHLDTPVARITTSHGAVSGVVTGDGRHFPATVVASNADVVHTYARLLADEPLARATARSLSRKRFSMSLFVIYFGLRRQHRSLKHHMVLFGPRYQGLLEDIYEHGVLPRDFAIYLHHPTATDPAMAPDGKSIFTALVPVEEILPAATTADLVQLPRLYSSAEIGRAHV